MKLGSLAAWSSATAWLCVTGTGALPTAGAAAVATADQGSRAQAVDVVHQFPNNTWLENLAVRSNGQVLVTVLTTPDLYQVNPSNGKATLIHRFTNHLSLFGIAELGNDIFYVIAGNYSQPMSTNTVGAWDVYRVNMGVTHNRVTLASHFPNAVLLNGMAVLNAKTGLLLIGDAGAGVVYRLNVNTGVKTVVIDDPSMKPPAGTPVGIDGLQVHKNTLYFSNANGGTFNKIPLRAVGTAAGPVVVLTRDLDIDDFTFDKLGRIYLTVTFSDEVYRLDVGSTTPHVIAGPSSKLDGPSACKFGRTGADRNTLYVTTNGGLGVADNSSHPGGTLSRIEVRI
ncbi:MAG: hypothetical protein Q9168_005730 [Polycauliona sp. 1 TL-2023]